MRLRAIIPAAGIGSRMQSDIPKQYLDLDGRCVLQHTIERLVRLPIIDHIVIAIREDDPHWHDLYESLDSSLQEQIIVTGGGEERCNSVINALRSLAVSGDFDMDSDWVMVHDAVRPCVPLEDLERLVQEAMPAGGGILAAPVRDTMKRQDDSGNIAQTVDRDGLWHALTPQMFLAGSLLDALLAAQDAGVTITDEASAMEYAGSYPKLVQGSDRNIKITRPDDLMLAKHYLRTE